MAAAVRGTAKESGKGPNWRLEGRPKRLERQPNGFLQVSPRRVEGVPDRCGSGPEFRGYVALIGSFTRPGEMPVAELAARVHNVAPRGIGV